MRAAPPVDAALDTGRRERMLTLLLHMLAGAVLGAWLALHAELRTATAWVFVLSASISLLAALGWLFQREKMRAGYARYRGVLEGATGTLFMLFGGRLLWRALVR